MLHPDDQATVVIPERAEQPAVPQGKPGIRRGIGLVSRVDIERSVQPDLPLAIEDYALIGDCTTAVLGLHRLVVLATLRRQRLFCGSAWNVQQRAMADLSS